MTISQIHTETIKQKHKIKEEEEKNKTVYQILSGN